MSIKMTVNGSEYEPSLMGKILICGIGVPVVTFALVLIALLVLSVRLAVIVLPLVLALVIAFHVARYAGVEFGLVPTPVVAKGVGG